MASRSELESRVQFLRCREADLLAQAAVVSAALRPPADRAAEKPRPPTLRMKEVALRIFALARLQVEPALKYLSLQGRAATEADVRAWHAALSAEAQAALQQAAPDDQLAQRRLGEARKFLNELGLVTWVQEQNYSKGIAPTSTLILERAGRDLVRSRQSKNKMRWVRRLMRRWGGHRGRFGYGDGLSLEDFRAKVCLALQPIVGRRADQKSGLPRAAFRAQQLGLKCDPPDKFSYAGPQMRPVWRSSFPASACGIFLG